MNGEKNEIFVSSGYNDTDCCVVNNSICILFLFSQKVKYLFIKRNSYRSILYMQLAMACGKSVFGDFL